MDCWCPLFTTAGATRPRRLLKRARRGTRGARTVASSCGPADMEECDLHPFEPRCVRNRKMETPGDFFRAASGIIECSSAPSTMKWARDLTAVPKWRPAMQKSRLRMIIAVLDGRVRLAFSRPRVKSILENPEYFSAPRRQRLQALPTRTIARGHGRSIRRIAQDQCQIRIASMGRYRATTTMRPIRFSSFLGALGIVALADVAPSCGAGRAI